MLNQLKKNHFYLIETAKKMISQRFKENRHHFAAALKARDGKIFTGLQLKTSIAGVEVCAEAVALAAAAEEGVTDIEALVVVNRIGEVIAPCGRCRELFIDYCPKAEIIVPGPAGARILTPAELLPSRSSMIDDKHTT
jgi:cytidine deaminase